MGKDVGHGKCASFLYNSNGLSILWACILVVANPHPLIALALECACFPYVIEDMCVCLLR